MRTFDFMSDGYAIIPVDTIVGEQRLSPSEFKTFTVLTGLPRFYQSISFDRLAELTRQSTATVVDSVELLCGRRRIVKSTSIKNGRKQRNRYKVISKAGGKNFVKFPLALIGAVKATTCVIYAYLLMHCGHKGVTDGKCFSSLRDISRDLKIAKSTVLSALSELTEQCWIDRDKRVYEKNRKTNAYRSSVITLLPIPEKIDPSELPVRVETHIGRVLTFTEIFGAKIAKIPIVSEIVKFVKKIAHKLPKNRSSKFLC